MFRLFYLLFMALCIHGATAAIVRKQPAFATPIYSDSYLPASMQVIFHLVDQLKRIDAEEVDQNLLLTPATSPHPPGQRQPLPTPSIIGTIDDIKTPTISDDEKYYIPPERYQEEALIIAIPGGVSYEKIGTSQVTPEVNHEESEVVYGVPETNYELQESNHEVPEESHVNFQPQLGTLSVPDEIPGNDKGEKSEDETSTRNEFKTSSELVPSDATTSTVDSVVKEIYSIIKTTSTDNRDSISSVEGEVVGEKLNDKINYDASSMDGKNSAVNIPAENLSENIERSDELKDDKRFTLLGERIDQVPRPSLVAFLRAANATTNPVLYQMSQLYDAMSKDARRQGFSKYAGYSEKVLQFLQESGNGGAGIQLKRLLEKSVENQELTRYDAMEKTKETIDILNDDGSRLSTDLRHLIPLCFQP